MDAPASRRAPEEAAKVLEALRDVARGGELLVTVRGGSMVPAIADGTQLRVRARRHYVPGDVLVFSDASGGLTVHRYLGPLPRARLLTQGDAARGPDQAVPSATVLGMVVRLEGAPRYRVGPGARLRAFLRWLHYLALRVSASTRA